MKEEKFGNSNKKEWYAGFTLLEMLIVLFIISVLILLFVPNLSSQKKEISKRGDQAIEKVVKSQVELYKMNETGVVTYQSLQEKGYLTEEQVEKAKKIGVDLE